MKLLLNRCFGVRVETAGDTGLLPGSQVDWLAYEAANEKAALEGKEEATGSRTLLGITKASLATDSFLSAALSRKQLRY